MKNDCYKIQPQTVNEPQQHKLCYDKKLLQQRVITITGMPATLNLNYDNHMPIDENCKYQN